MNESDDGKEPSKKHFGYERRQATEAESPQLLHRIDGEHHARVVPAGLGGLPDGRGDEGRRHPAGEHRRDRGAGKRAFGRTEGRSQPAAHGRRPRGDDRLRRQGGEDRGRRVPQDVRQRIRGNPGRKPAARLVRADPHGRLGRQRAARRLHRRHLEDRGGRTGELPGADGRTAARHGRQNPAGAGALRRGAARHFAA